MLTMIAYQNAVCPALISGGLVIRVNQFPTMEDQNGADPINARYLGQPGVLSVARQLNAGLIHFGL